MSGLRCYENEDGEVWVPVESEPDEAVAGQLARLCRSPHSPRCRGICFVRQLTARRS